MPTVMSYLKCRTCYAATAAPAAVAVSVGVILVRWGGRRGRMLVSQSSWLMSQTLQFIPNGKPSDFSSALFHWEDGFVSAPWDTAGNDCVTFVSLRIEPRRRRTDTHLYSNPPHISTPPPRPLASARARGQVLSHGRHNWPNDWQVDTRAELWLWLPTRHFRGDHCANRALSCDCVHTEQKEKEAGGDTIIDKGFSPPFSPPRMHFIVALLQGVEGVRGQANLFFGSKTILRNKCFMVHQKSRKVSLVGKVLLFKAQV